MDIWVAKNKYAGKEILGTKYLDDGPFFQKEYNIWFNEPWVDTSSPEEENWLIRSADWRISEEELKRLFSFSKDTRLKGALVHDDFTPRKFKVQVIC